MSRRSSRRKIGEPGGLSLGQTEPTASTAVTGAFAQSTGLIEGTVVDPGEAAVSGAHVACKNVNTGIHLETRHGTIRSFGEWRDQIGQEHLGRERQRICW